MSSRERIIVTTCAASMTPRRVRWLFRDTLPMGMFSLLAGREGVGKSCIAAEFVACITKGEAIGDLTGRPADAMYVAAEDSWEHTVIPRLLAAGADLSRVHQVSVREGESLGDPSLPTDIDGLETRIRELGVRLIVLDPVISRLDSGLSTHVDGDVRKALEPLAALADRTDAVILGIIHVNKMDTADALTSVMGSRAFAATARAVLFAVRDGETNLLCFPKSNLGPPQPSRQYSIEGRTVGKDPSDGEPITAGAVKWAGRSDRRAEDVLADQVESRSRPRSISILDRAKAWLLDELGAGPVPAGKLKERAAAAGFRGMTLSRAADELNVTRERKGFGGGSMWALPAPEGEGDHPAQGEGEGAPLTGQEGWATEDAESPGDTHLHQPSRANLNDANDANGVNGMSVLSDPPILPPPHSHHPLHSVHSVGARTGGVTGLASKRAQAADILRSMTKAAVMA